MLLFSLLGSNWTGTVERVVKGIRYQMYGVMAATALVDACETNLIIYNHAVKSVDGESRYFNLFKQIKNKGDSFPTLLVLLTPNMPVLEVYKVNILVNVYKL